MYPFLIPSLLFLCGIVFGSFLNVVILRVVHGRSLLGRSQCMACMRTLHWFELIPLLSYAVTRGRCRSCRARLLLQYPLVEGVTGLFFVFAYFFHLQALQSFSLAFFFRDILFLSVLLVLFVQDFRFQVLPDIITLPAIGIAVLFWFIPSPNLQLTTYNLLALLIGGGFFLLQWLVSRGRWIGAGDIRLGALMGAMLGWPTILLALFLAYMSGASVSIIMMLLRRAHRRSAIAFGTFLTASTAFSLFWGEHIVRWYAHTIGVVL